MGEYSDKTVVITGGSTGIGAAFAERFARAGARLVLVARNAARLEAVAEPLRAAHGAQVLTLSEDLATPGAAGRVLQAVRGHGLTADILINNAGFGTYGHFEAIPLATQREEIDLNIGALVELTHVFLPDLLARRGGVIQVASTAAYQPVPYMAVYAATKAFVLSFSEALWGEYRDRGLRVLALCPGATDTPFFTRVGADEAALGKRASPESVVDAALRAFAADRSHLITGLGNYLTAQTSRFVPREATIRITGRLMRPRRARSLVPDTAREP